MQFMRNYMKINSLYNKEVGKRAFILANGPSVLNQDLSKLRNELVIGMNASILLDEKFKFFSKYYVISDHRFMTHPIKKDLGTKKLNKNTTRILRKELEELDMKSLNSRTCYIQAIGKNGFSENLKSGYFFGCTTTMLAIQLAYYLGCTEVYLLGCDLRYSTETPRFYEEENPQLEDSFTSVQIYNIANASVKFEQNGKKLFNCSPISYLLPYLPYCEYDSLFKGV